MKDKPLKLYIMTKSEAIKNLSTLIFKINEQHYALNNEKDVISGKVFDKKEAQDALSSLESLYEESLRAVLGNVGDN